MSLGAWFSRLAGDEQEAIAGAVRMLEEHGPGLGRPYVDTIKTSRHAHLKELRPPLGHVRVLFPCIVSLRSSTHCCSFDRGRQTASLVGVASDSRADCRSALRSASGDLESRRIVAMSGRRPFSDLATQINADPQRRQRVEAYVAAMRSVLDLAERRVASGRARAEIERALEAAYEQDAPPDRAIDVYLSALQPYVEALGERLEINAVFPDETITLRVSGDEDRVPTAPSVRSA
jgi:hypothetical protein